jgi:hypothetical protein
MNQALKYDGLDLMRKLFVAAPGFSKPCGVKSAGESVRFNR